MSTPHEIDRAVNVMLDLRVTTIPVIRIASDEIPPEFRELLAEDTGLWLDTENARVTMITDRKKITTKQIRTLLDASYLAANSAQELELVTQHAIGWQAQNPFLARNQPRCRVGSTPILRIIGWTQVILQPLNHVLVPAQRRATPQEVQRFRHLRNLPSIHATDIVIMHLGMSSGEVLRIDRKDGSVYWRLVVP